MEVAVNNLGLSKEKAESYLLTEFPYVWNRFDVNEEGKVEVGSMP